MRKMKKSNQIREMLKKGHYGTKSKKNKQIWWILTIWEHFRKIMKIKSLKKCQILKWIYQSLFIVLPQTDFLFKIFKTKKNSNNFSKATRNGSKKWKSSSVLREKKSFTDEVIL